MAAIMPEEKFRPSWRSFDYQELVDATDGFNEGTLFYYLFNSFNFYLLHMQLRILNTVEGIKKSCHLCI